MNVCGEELLCRFSKTHHQQVLMDERKKKNDLFYYIFYPIFALFYWRGTWNLCNLLIYQNNLLFSSIISLIIGYGGLAVSLFLQIYIKKSNLIYDLLGIEMNSRWYLYLSKLIYRFHLYLIGFYVVNCWRGLWLLQDRLILTNYPLISALISHLIGVISLFLFNYFQTVFAPPVLILSDKNDVPVSDGYETIITNCIPKSLSYYSSPSLTNSIELTA